MPKEAGRKGEGSETQGLRLRKVEKVLGIYLHGLLGRNVPVRESKESYTDTKAVYLPKSVSEFSGEEDNFKLYKAMLAHNYAQLKYSDAREAQEHFQHIGSDRFARDIYSVIESARMESKLAEEFRGMRRDLEYLKQRLAEKRPSFAALTHKEAALEALIQRLLIGKVKEELPKRITSVVERCFAAAQKALRPEASTKDSAKAAREIYDIITRDLGGDYGEELGIQYAGRIKYEEIARTREVEKEELKKLQTERVTRTREFRKIFKKGPLFKWLYRMLLGPMDVAEISNEQGLKVKRRGELREVQRPLDSRLPSHGKALSSFGDASWVDYHLPGSAARAVEERLEPRAFLYDEWDYKAQEYRSNWCTLMEEFAKRQGNGFVEEALAKNSRLVSKVKKQFEAFRADYKKLTRQIDGEDVDLDAYIENFAEAKAGGMPGDGIYIHRAEKQRSIAVGFLLDQSSSTADWVLDVEKEALLVMCEALEVLGDSYAICGFSSNTRRECNFYIAKNFHERYGRAVKDKIAGMDALGYTRMGAPIRHMAKKLGREKARIKLMILLSDGRPHDYDGYDGAYAIEDTRMALLEARKAGVHQFCITVDTQALSYIPHMFGKNNYIIIDEVAQLPVKLPRIYRQLTC